MPNDYPRECPNCGAVYLDETGRCHACGMQYLEACRAVDARNAAAQAQARKAAAQAQDRNYYLETVNRLEPDIAMIDPGAYYASAAVSLKRIADALEKLVPIDTPLINDHVGTYTDENGTTFPVCIVCNQNYASHLYNEGIGGISKQGSTPDA